MSESSEEMKLTGEASRAPDHSLLFWDVQLDGVDYKEKAEGGFSGKRTRQVVPEVFLEDKVADIRRLADRVAVLGKDQEAIDEVYEEMVKILNGGLREKSVGMGSKRQPWFTRELARLRVQFHRAEKDWLSCSDEQLRRQKRLTYLELRREYKKWIFKVRRNYEEYKCSELESMMGNPKKWWAMAKKLNVAGNDGQHADTSIVYDKDGSVKVGKEALVVCKSYFEGILNESEEVGRQFCQW